jgi:hypothetical protein
MLWAEPDVIKKRFLQRGWKPHRVDEAIREVAELKWAKFADLQVDTNDQSAEEVARMVRDQAGNWPSLT